MKLFFAEAVLFGLLSANTLKIELNQIALEINTEVKNFSEKKLRPIANQMKNIVVDSDCDGDALF